MLLIVNPRLLIVAGSMLVAVSGAHAGSQKDTPLPSAAPVVEAAPVSRGRATHCFEKVATAPLYKTVGRKVLVRPARRERRFIPAVYGTKTKKVLVRPAQTVREHRRAVYVTKRKRVLVQPGRVHYRQVPAVYRDMTMSRIIEPARVTWEYRGFRHKKLCKVVIPAKVEHYTKRIMVSPARQVAVHEPAQYRTEMSRVLVKPAQSVQRTIAPRYELRSQRVLIAKERYQDVTVPPVYGMHYDRVLVRPSGQAWRQTPPC